MRVLANRIGFVIGIPRCGGVAFGAIGYAQITKPSSLCRNGLLG
jgi:hypothetical protein